MGKNFNRFQLISIGMNARSLTSWDVINLNPLQCGVGFCDRLRPVGGDAAIAAATNRQPRSPLMGAL